MRTLPEGRLGQGLAVLLLLLVLASGWVGVVAPLLDWHAARAETIEGRRALGARMAQVAATLPALQRLAVPAAAATVPVLDGGTDAVAAAQLQQQVQALAAAAGATLSSAEFLAAEPAGDYRRIGLRVTLNAPWPVLMRLMQAIVGGAPDTLPHLMIDDVQLHGSRAYLRDKATPIAASWVVLGFRPGSPSGSPPGSPPRSPP